MSGFFSRYLNRFRRSEKLPEDETPADASYLDDDSKDAIDTEDAAQNGPIGLPIAKIGDEIIRTKANQHHVTVVGRTRSGKSTSVAMPMLLDHEGPAVVIDVKGELFERTSAQRAKYGPVVVLDPFKVKTEHSHSISPLDFIRMEKEGKATTARRISDLLTISSSNTANGDYWESQASSYIAMMLLIAAAAGSSFTRAIEDIVNRKDAETAIIVVEEYLPAQKIDFGFGRLRNGKFASLQKALSIAKAFDNPELSILATANTSLFIFQHQGLIKLFEETTFDIDAVLDGGTIYIIWPPELLSTMSTAVRLLFGLLLDRAMMRKPAKSDRLFIVDEAGILGKIKQIEDGLVIGAGAGNRIVTCWQSFSQMTANYGPNGKLLLDQAGMILMLSGADHETNSMISDMTGHEMTANDIRTLPPDEILAIPAGEMPFRAKKNRAISDDGYVDPRIGIMTEIDTSALQALAYGDLIDVSLLDKAAEKPKELALAAVEPTTVEPKNADNTNEERSLTYVRNFTATHADILASKPPLPPLQSFTSPQPTFEDPVERAENLVFRALTKETSGRAVFRDLALPSDSNDGFGLQIDLAVVCEKIGIYLVETKGGIVSYDEKIGWQVASLSNPDVKMPGRSPGKQVKRAAAEVSKMIEQIFGRRILVQKAVAFPDLENITLVDGYTADCLVWTRDTIGVANPREKKYRVEDWGHSDFDIPDTALGRGIRALGITSGLLAKIARERCRKVKGVRRHIPGARTRWLIADHQLIAAMFFSALSRRTASNETDPAKAIAEAVADDLERLFAEKSTETCNAAASA